MDPIRRLDTVVAARADVLSSDVANEMLLLSLERGHYFGLDPVGAHIWRQLQAPRTVTQLRDAVMERFDVDAERCESDLMVLLEQLLEQGLIDVAAPEADV